MPDIVLTDASYEDAMAGVAEHRTEVGAALLQKDRQLRQTLSILKGGQILQSRLE